MNPVSDNPFQTPALPGTKTVLVDTSLLIEQQKREKYAKPVRLALAPFRFRGASSYSKLEFKRAWLQRLAYIHTTSLRSDVGTIIDLIAYFNRKLASHPMQRRRLQTCMDALIRFFDLTSCDISRPAQLARLRAHCKRCVLDATRILDDMVTGYFKHSRCSRAEELARELPDGSLDIIIRKCRPSSPQCDIVRFFKDNMALFTAIADYVDSHAGCSEELKTMRDHIRQAIKTPTHLCDDKNCTKVADAIIAIDGKDMEVFAANNNREWDHICKVFGKTLLNPVHTPFSTP